VGEGGWPAHPAGPIPVWFRIHPDVKRAILAEGPPAIPGGVRAGAPDDTIEVRTTATGEPNGPPCWLN
jgi:hypothetical protein